MRRTMAALPLLLLALLIRQVPLEPPLQLANVFRLDALAGLMLVALLLGLIIAWGGLGAPLLRSTAVALALAVAYLAVPAPLVLAGFIVAVLSVAHRDRLLRTVLPLLLLAGGIGWLVWRAQHSAITSPALLSSVDTISFGLFLLAAFLGMELPPLPASNRADILWSLLVRPAWLYPLARLYEFGTWNAGWVLATALLGGTATLWAGWTAPWAGDEETRLARVEAALLAAALASLGLISEAGLAGALVGVLAAVTAIGGIAARRRHPLLWLVAGPVPLSLPFVAIWLQISAAVAGGLVLLAAALWLSAIGWAVAALRSVTGGRSDPAGWTLRALALLSMLAGIASPLLLSLLVQPVLVQLGAGITPYGRPVAWPWLGLEVRSAGGATVTSWHSIAIGGLLLLLAAIAYLLVRLLELYQRERSAPGRQNVLPSALWGLVRRSVPWLPRQEADDEHR